MADSFIAIVGMAGRFPGANTIAEFWSNLLHGTESITHFSEEELLEAGCSLDEVQDPNYIKAKGVLADADHFDADFFLYKNSDARLMDPQHRIILETAYHALEDYGYSPKSVSNDIGVFVSASASTYLLQQIIRNPKLINEANYYNTILANGNDFIATKISYKLDLKGPAQTIQTGCSSSLVAVHNACQSLLNYECDAALAGGVCVTIPFKSGYLHRKGGITTPDGHCRPFDQAANGTLHGNGVGIVVLKRLEDAINDNDRIYAIIRGSAINNDGSTKIGYTAPSIVGQSRVIRAAQAIAQTPPETIGYIEAHGTGTALGDPIEIAGLTEAFGNEVPIQNCALGSLKGNIGHLDVAAGITGLIKAILAIHHNTIPATINHDCLNEKIDLEKSPFYINTSPIAWPNERTRRAGVSSFGIGGTNAHVILEEHPSHTPIARTGKPYYILPLSAKTDVSLQRMKADLIAHLKQSNDSLADMEFTLQQRRIHHPCRSLFLCKYDEGLHISEITPNNSDSLFSETERNAFITWLSSQADDFDLSKSEGRVVALPHYPFVKKYFSADFHSIEKAAAADEIRSDTTTISEGIKQAIEKFVSSTIDVDTTLENLGIDSLAIVDLTLVLETQLGINIPFGTLQRDSTANTISKALAANATKVIPFKHPIGRMQLATTIKEGNSEGPPLFCLHPAGGNISIFLPLANHLRDGQKIIAIRSPDSKHSANGSIKALAALYTEIIRSIQPQGPYHLCGSSLGGVVAFEVSRNLLDEHDEIALLAMLDSPCPGFLPTQPINSDAEIHKYISNLSTGMAAGINNVATPSQSQKDFYSLWRQHRDALVSYKPEPAPATILFFKAQNELVHNIEQGWVPLAKGGIEIHEVTGNHLTMHQEPHIEKIAAVLNRKLELIELQKFMFKLQHTLPSMEYRYA